VFWYWSGVALRGGEEARIGLDTEARFAIYITTMFLA
jgi:hypothetical protein